MTPDAYEKDEEINRKLDDALGKLRNLKILPDNAVRKHLDEVRQLVRRATRGFEETTDEYGALGEELSYINTHHPEPSPNWYHVTSQSLLVSIQYVKQATTLIKAHETLRLFCTRQLASQNLKSDKLVRDLETQKQDSDDYLQDILRNKFLVDFEANLKHFIEKGSRLIQSYRVLNPELCALIESHASAKSFRMTDAEVELCARLHAGEPQREIESILGISRGTFNRRSAELRGKFGLPPKTPTLREYLQHELHLSSPSM